MNTFSKFSEIIVFGLIFKTNDDDFPISMHKKIIKQHTRIYIENKEELININHMKRTYIKLLLLLYSIHNIIKNIS